MAQSIGASAASLTGTEWVTRERQWIRRDGVVRPFFFRGVWPVLGLVLLGLYGLRPFAVGDIEATVQRETEAALSRAGLGWVDVTVSGQDVILTGSEPVAGDGARALDIARAAMCPSLFGRKTCAVSVTGAFAQPVAAAAVEAAPPVAAQAAVCEQSLADIVGARKIAFASGSAVIGAASAGVIRDLAAAVARCPGNIRIEGHTDSLGAEPANRTLSQQRADAVLAALSAAGVPRERLQAQGLASDRPLGDNTTAAGRALNRRIEFHVSDATVP